MADWPTLSDGYYEQPLVDQPVLDPTIRSETASGHVRTRLRFPAVPRQWQFTIRFMSAADVTTLKTFEHTTVGYGSGTFNWTNPEDSTVYVVRLGAPFQFTQDGIASLWRTPVILVEASATQ